MAGGIYIVTLNNKELISTQAHDRRYDNRETLKVNFKNIKFGKAFDFNTRKNNYYKTFKKHNVNFIPVVTLPSEDDINRAEKIVKSELIDYLLCSPVGNETEWTKGISKEQMIKKILTSIKSKKILKV